MTALKMSDLPTTHLQCTKYPVRQHRLASPTPTLPLPTRLAIQQPVRRRCDVEPKTEGGSFWGAMEAKEGMQTQPKVWVTSHHVDYPHRPLAETGRDRNAVKERSAVMRTQSIWMGNDKAPRVETESNATMKRLPRAYYVGRIRFPRGGPHKKTVSELYLCPADTTAWRQTFRSSMSHRQFPPRPTEANLMAEDRKEIQRDMLASHFDVKESTQGSWVTQSQADFSPRSVGAPGKAAKAMSSCVPLTDSNFDWKKTLSTTTASAYALSEKLPTSAAGGSGASRPASAGGGLQPEPPLSRGMRTKTHTRHSWQLGYDAPDDTQYITEQKLAFRKVKFMTPSSLGDSVRDRQLCRRNSQQFVVHTSSVPLSHSTAGPADGTASSKQ